MRFLSRPIPTTGVREEAQPGVPNGEAGFKRRCNARLVNPPAHATPDDGQRTWVRAMGEVLGYPHFPIGPGLNIAAGKVGWETFAVVPIWNT